jgi:enamine deaminase RidA (YjgF/YER057c/UK114 family)
MTTSDIAYTPILPEGWTRPRGFSHGIVATGTRSVRIAGQIGREPGQAHIPPGPTPVRNAVALGNLVTVLKAAGGKPDTWRRCAPTSRSPVQRMAPRSARCQETRRSAGLRR